MIIPLKWEFPGGKILVDENVEKALIREINEELMIDIFEYKFFVIIFLNIKN